TFIGNVSERSRDQQQQILLSWNTELLPIKAAIAFQQSLTQSEKRIRRLRIPDSTKRNYCRCDNAIILVGKTLDKRIDSLPRFCDAKRSGSVRAHQRLLIIKQRQKGRSRSAYPVTYAGERVRRLPSYVSVGRSKLTRNHINRRRLPEFEQCS